MSTVHYQAVSLVEKQPWEDDYPISAESDLDHPTRGQNSISRTNFEKYWIWLLHALLLVISTSLFLGSFASIPTTSDYVERFSAWSPAADAIEYESVRFNVTTQDNRFVGKGPEVDQAWLEISYDSKFHRHESNE